VAVLDQHHDATETIGLVIEKMRKMLSWVIGALAARILPADRIEPADLAAPRHHHGRPGSVPLSISRLKASTSVAGERSSARPFPAWHRERRVWGRLLPAAVWASLSLPLALVL